MKGGERLNGEALRHISEIKKLLQDIRDEIERMENGDETTLWYVYRKG